MRNLAIELRIIDGLPKAGRVRSLSTDTSCHRKRTYFGAGPEAAAVCPRCRSLGTWPASFIGAVAAPDELHPSLCRRSGSVLARLWWLARSPRHRPRAATNFLLSRRRSPPHLKLY